MSRILLAICITPLLLFAAVASAAGAPVILVYGDSLSAGYGIRLEQSWPALLQQRLQQEKLPHQVINASISGETTAGGRSRIAATLQKHRPAIFILALGANDGLRGLPLPQMRANLDFITTAAQQAGARVLIAGMRMPPNYGPVYTRRFAAVTEEIAAARKTALLPFLLQPIALDIDAFQADGLHPTAAAQTKILDHLWPALQPLLRQ